MKTRRDTPPPLVPLAPPALLPYRQVTLSNGLPVVYLHDPCQEVLRLDVVLPHGTYYQPRPVVASATVNLLNGGTRSLPAAAIAGIFDFHGASVDLNCGVHRSEITLLALHGHAARMVEVLASMLLESVFPRREMEIYLRNRKQQHAVNMEKTSYLASQTLASLLHGEHHPYANRLEAADFDRVTVDEVKAFHRARLSAPACRLVLSGNVSDALLQAIDRCFSAMPREPLPPDDEIPTAPAPPGTYRVEKPGAVQSSIRVGKVGVRLASEDHAPFQLLNMALGGYFGSRLMSNIREEKGYTYGINSMNVTLARGAWWTIATEVNARQAEATLAEIHREIRRLREEPLPVEELQVVKSYYHGELLRELDGTFAQADALKYYLEHGTDTTYCLRALDQIHHCTPETLLLLAREYLDPSEMYTVIAGDPHAA
jgi:predicted Zn-dependent peptidase